MTDNSDWDSEARKCLEAQLAVFRTDTMEHFTKFTEALGAAREVGSDCNGKSVDYMAMMTKLPIHEAAVRSLENALLNNRLGRSDYSDIPPENIPSQFARAKVPEQISVTPEDDDDEIIYCG